MNGYDRGQDETMLHTTTCLEYTEIKGILFPKGTRFRDLIVTGPPGSGKSTLMKKLGGWFQEGFLDLTFPAWWKDKIFFTTPREIHLGLPFRGCDRPLAVFQPEWKKEPKSIDYDRILLPPIKNHFWNVDWRNRFVYEFLIPPADIIFQRRQLRAKQRSHRVDTEFFSLEIVEKQVAIYQEMACFWHQNGFITHIREDLDGPPLVFGPVNSPEN